MYIPTANRVADLARVRSFLHAHGFATLVTQTQAGPWASHLPVLLDEHEGSSGVLRGHLARANEQWQHFRPDQEVLCLFQGPHAYISPTWYAAPVAVPTWNYATVHVYGIPEVRNDPGFVRQIVEDTTARYEAGRTPQWRLNLPEAQVAALLQAIVGFTIRITRIEAKFKLGQNRSPEDQAGMLRGLSRSAAAGDRALAEFIRGQE
ncbi:MAG: FMN-binding negative transcriptional regulator [Armatimonadetes bacterium]|nr:FMN-binding negative transcriptional regulator [Armatimonadota bacterium]